LALAVAAVKATAVVTTVTAVRFEKFLALPALNRPSIEGYVDLTPLADGRVEALLMTRHTAPRTGMTRMKVHARACFGPRAIGAPGPAHTAAPPPAQAFAVPAERLYAELVPFGPVFRNVTAPVKLWPQGAWALVAGGSAAVPGLGSPLGSFLTLDAAFHATCAWAQRYRGRVAFPVAMAARSVHPPTRVGLSYEALIQFREEDGPDLIFDLELHDQDGRCCESIRKLAMRDMSGGRLTPPDWIRAQ
jgi:hypothetical protein